MYTPRYVRTRDHRRRRLTLGHVATQHKARALSDDLLSVRDLLHAWHIEGPFGMRPAGVGRARRCIYARRRQREATAWAETQRRLDAERQHWQRYERRVEYFRLRPFANGSEYDWWTVRNCERCAAYDACPLRDAIEEAACGDGMLSNAVAGRIWREGRPRDLGPCAEWRHP